MKQFLRQQLVILIMICGVQSSKPLVAGQAYSVSQPTPYPAPSSEGEGWIDRFDNFDTTRWCRSGGLYKPFWVADGLTGTWDQASVTVEEGQLVLRTTVHKLDVTAAEVGTCHKFGYGSYEAAVMIAPLSGIISAMFSYLQNSETEIDVEFEGRDPLSLHTVTWRSSVTKEHEHHSYVSALTNTWHKIKYEWLAESVKFYLDDVLIAEHKMVVPSAPASLIFNLWPTNNAQWGGLSSDGAAILRVDWVKFTPAPAVPFTSELFNGNR